MATKVFDPEFLRPTRALAGREWRNSARGSATTRRLSPQSSRRHPAAAALFEK
jgi:hypothetical protein